MMSGHDADNLACPVTFESFERPSNLKADAAYGPFSLFFENARVLPAQVAFHIDHVS